MVALSQEQFGGQGEGAGYYLLGRNTAKEYSGGYRSSYEPRATILEPVLDGTASTDLVSGMPDELTNPRPPNEALKTRAALLSSVT